MKRIEYKWIALSCTTLGALFSVLSGSTLIIALPVIMKDLHADMGVIMWTVMIYLLSITIFVPAIGRVADMFGRKKLYLGGFTDIAFSVPEKYRNLPSNGRLVMIHGSCSFRKFQ